MYKKSFKSFILLLVALTFIVPSVVFGQGGAGNNSGPLCDIGDTAGFAEMFKNVTCIIYKTFVPMVFALAIALFVWGVTMYVVNAEDEGKREKGKDFMIWGIIGLTVMISIWGLVAILGDTFGLDTSIVPQAPGGTGN